MQDLSTGQEYNCCSMSDSRETDLNAKLNQEWDGRKDKGKSICSFHFVIRV